MLRRHARRFLTVGAVGFIVDLAVLGALVHAWGVDPIPARIAAFLAAIAVTYVGNAHYTFESTLKDSSLSRYVVVQAIGAAINLGVFTWLVLYAGMREQPMIALAIGAMLATVSNFLLSRRFVFGGSA